MFYRYLFSRKFHRTISIFINAFIIFGIIISINVIPAVAMDIPQQIYPPDNSVTTSESDPPLGVPSFSWSTVTGATKYRLQVDNEVGFNAPITMDITTRNTSYSPNSSNHLFVDGDWYWRVRVEEPAPVGEWSPIMRFTKTWATTTNAPALVAPLNGSTLAFFDKAMFSWDPVIGAASYLFQISTDEGFSTITLNVSTIATTTQPTTRLANGTYYWRVIPLDASDHYGTISEVRSFTLAYGQISTDLVPQLYEPVDESFPTFTPTFHWSAIEGAEEYLLEYTSEENCDFSVGTAVYTKQTSYTPINTFPNDVRYCWHVRVESGVAVGDWSDTLHFEKRWYLQPQLLTPTNLYQNGLYPIYSWTPVPGASRYRIDIAMNPSFSPLYEFFITANTTYAPQSKYTGTAHYFWRVTPIDGSGQYGLTSEVHEFWSYYDSEAPILVYPLYYYIPNDPVYYGEYSMNPVEDRTVALPIFIWQRVMGPWPNGGVYALAYRIQVDTTPYFSNIVWQYDTENTSATPTDANDFSPLVGQDYYWRVCVLDQIGGNCIDPSLGWSQTWRARFDFSLALPPTNQGSPVLLRPAIGQESVEATPLLEWYPLIDADKYQVDVSRNMDFSTHEVSETVSIPSYSPVVSMAQRRLDRTDYGTFYWRVRGLVNDVWGDWSTPGRFQIASQSGWTYTRNPSIIDTETLVGSDPGGDAAGSYDLTGLYASQCSQCSSPVPGAYWFLGISTTVTNTAMTYVVYIDLDHVDGSGGTTPPERPYNVNVIPAHQPEYVIYVDNSASGMDRYNTWVYKWNGTSWEFGDRFSNINGYVYTSSNYVQLQIPNAAIGMSQVTSSASVMVFSVDPGTNELVDSVPSDPAVPGTALLSRFTSVSDHMNLIFPPSTRSGDPTVVPSALPLYWDWPTGSVYTTSTGVYTTTPYAGSNIEIHLDAAYTNRVYETRIETVPPFFYFAMNKVTYLKDIIGDNIYYWRVQPRYYLPDYGAAFGAWTGGFSFRRLGYTAQNLQTSVTWATPTFSWDRVEGASTYRLQVSTDPNFGSTAFPTLVTPMTSYTPVSTLPQGTYYWRVQANRYENITNDWSEVVSFTLSLPTPTGLSPNGDNVNYAPTLCWDPLISYDQNKPVLTAWKYRVQLSQDPNFSIIYDNVDTTFNCWTPVKGYHDGAYYWHVAMIDGNSRVGNYTAAATFTKQYPMTTLISPIDASLPNTPTFVWEPVDGAARYVLEVSKYPTFSPNYDTVTTFNTQYTPVKVYDINTVYYWRVAILDDYGRQGPFSDATVIIVGPPSAFNKENPANSATNQPKSLTLNWGESFGATGYEYCIDTTRDNLCSDWVSTGVINNVTLSNLSPNTTYSWQVRATNYYGTTYANGSETNYWSFTTGNIPGAFTKLSPKDNATNQPTSLILDWSDSSGVLSYEYCYDTTGDDICTNWVSTGLASNTTLNGLNPSTTYYWQVRAKNGFGFTYANVLETSFWRFTIEGNIYSFLPMVYK